MFVGSVNHDIGSEDELTNLVPTTKHGDTITLVTDNQQGFKKWRVLPTKNGGLGINLIDAYDVDLSDDDYELSDDDDDDDDLNDQPTKKQRIGERIGERIGGSRKTNKGKKSKKKSLKKKSSKKKSLKKKSLKKKSSKKKSSKKKSSKKTYSH